MTYDALVVGGGQAGLTAAYRLKEAGLSYRVLNASDESTGSWPQYYDSLTLFSPAEYSSLPGMDFPGNPKDYPVRDEVVDYLRAYAKRFDLDIQNGTNITELQRDNGHFVLTDAKGNSYESKTVIAASGSFNEPFVPIIPGRTQFAGECLHSIDYVSPERFAGKRVIVVGAANTAVQIAYELAQVAHTTLAVRNRVQYVPQRILGKDFHFWLGLTGLGKTRWLKDQSTPVLDTGKYKTAIRSGKPDQRTMFTEFSETGVVWGDGTREDIDAVLFATGYGPNLSYLSGLNAAGRPVENGSRFGVSKRVPGLYYLGFSGQRSFESATLRGVGPDSLYIMRHLKRHLG